MTPVINTIRTLSQHLPISKQSVIPMKLIHRSMCRTTPEKTPSNLTLAKTGAQSAVGLSMWIFASYLILDQIYTTTTPDTKNLDQHPQKQP